MFKFTLSHNIHSTQAQPVVEGVFMGEKEEKKFFVIKFC
jgi:hypothetical protein